jgi:CheY-like chemotaxis protein
MAAISHDQQIIVERHDDAPVQGRKVLIIDDDVRNIFSLTSALEQQGMEVVFSENGREGIEKLKSTPDIDVVLVDIMMPEMDGYETMQEIRKLPQYADLPLIAVTAKAMKGDREKCLDAGANDYVSKPVDIDQLLAVLRIQLGRSTYLAREADTHANGAVEDGLRP